MKQFLFIILALTLLPSCGKKNQSSRISQTQTVQDPLVIEASPEGSYRAILRPLNNQLSGFLPSGIAEIKISNDSVAVKTLLDDDARVIHRQSIHIGSVCPRNDEHDLNQDGLIDIVEAYQASGEVYIPLDSDLNSAEAGSSVYPMGGNFTYIENASLKKMMEDVKFRTGHGLMLNERVVLIHGVDEMTKLPESVATINGIPKQTSIPIACGILTLEDKAKEKR